MASRTLPEMPCGPILELYGQRKRFHVPYGLKGLIEDMTREVLRHQPNNLYEFLAIFMEERVEKKIEAQEQNKKRKSWDHHRWSWQGTSHLSPEELNEFMDTLQAPPEAAEHSALVIQSAFRGYQARKQVKELRNTVYVEGNRKSITEGETEGPRKSRDEQGKRKSVQYAEPDSTQGAESESKEDKSGTPQEGGDEDRTLRLSMDNATDAEQHAAVKIQAAFRGHMGRKKVDKIKEDHEHEHEQEVRKSIMFQTNKQEDEGEPQGNEQADLPPDAQQNEESDPNRPSGAYHKSEISKRQSERESTVKPLTEAQKRQFEAQKRQSEIQARLSEAVQRRQSDTQPRRLSEARQSETQSKRLSGAKRKSELKGETEDPNNQSEPAPENQTEQQEPASQGEEEAK